MKLVGSWDEAAQEILTSNADVYSFDIFDTLLLRKYHPDLVIGRVAAWLDERQGKEAGASLRAFHAVYRKLAVEQERHGNDREVLGDALFSTWAGEDAEALLDFYVQLEIDALARNHTYHSLLRELVAQDKAVIIISDMYLPARAIERLLSHFGYSDLYSRLFVSSEVALLKRSGRLFEHVRNELNIAPNAKWIHSGDNQEADGKQPAAKGLVAVVNPHVHWEGGVTTPKGNSAGEVVYRALNRRGANFWESYGFNRLGPIFASYIHGLTSYAQAHHLSSLLFPAREGLFLKELYQTFLAESGQQGPEAHYVYLSRAATLYYGGGADDYAFGCIRQNGARTLKSLVSNLLSADQVDGLAGRMGVAADQVLSLSDTEALCHKLAADPVVSAAGLDKHKATVAALTPYMSALGVFEGGPVGFVDVGWGAQIQYSLFRGLKQHAEAQGLDVPEVHGLYMGVNGYALHRQADQCFVTGLLCTEWDAPWSDTALMEFPGIAELACRAPHGTVMRLEATADGEVVPVLRDSSSASRQKELEDEPYLAHLQAGIIAYLKGYASILKQHPFSFEDTQEFALRMAERCVRYPDTAEIEQLGRLINVADLGQDTHAKLANLWWHARQAHLPKAYRYAKLLAFVFATQRSLFGQPPHRQAVVRTRLSVPAQPKAVPSAEQGWQALAEQLRAQPVEGALRLNPISERELRSIRRMGVLAEHACHAKQLLRRVKRAVVRR